MPTFYNIDGVMSDGSEVEVEVTIDVDDFYNELSESEKSDLVDLLVDDGYSSALDSNDVSIDNWLDEEWNEALDKLRRGRMVLSKEDEEIVKLISKKLL